MALISSAMAQVPVLLCEMLGIDPGQVQEIVIRFAYRDIVAMTIHGVVTKGQDEQLVRIFKGVAWEEVTDV